MKIKSKYRKKQETKSKQKKIFFKPILSSYSSPLNKHKFDLLSDFIIKFPEWKKSVGK
jgi:hypothetical protein